MIRPLTNILNKIFGQGFYKAHAGMLMVVMLILVAPGGDLIGVHKALMSYLIAKPLGMITAFCVLLIYTLKCWHFVSITISGVHQQFLFYSLNCYSRYEQLKAWIILQALISLPVFLYMICVVILAVGQHYFLSAFIILLYMSGLLFFSAFYYSWKINRLIDRSKSSSLLNLVIGFKKPLFTLFIYYVFDSLKVKYLIIKLLSYLVTMIVFILFADVKTDVRIGSIAMLAIATAHSLFILEEREFGARFLMFAKTMPITRFRLYVSQLLMYILLLLPEAIWLLWSLPVMQATSLFVLCVSIIMLFASVLHLIGISQERYMKVIFGLFVLIFMAILYQLMWILLFVNLLAGYFIFYFNYYRSEDNLS